MNREEHFKRMRDHMALFVKQAQMMHPLFLPSSGKKQKEVELAKSCRICGKGYKSSTRCWYSGDWLCEECKSRYSFERSRIVIDRNVEGMIECSRAIGVPTSDRLWAIVPCKGESNGEAEG